MSFLDKVADGSVNFASDMKNAATDFVKGKSFKRVGNMNKRSIVKVAIKTALVALAAGIIGALLGGVVGFAILFPIVALGAFAYFTSPQVQDSSFVRNAVCSCR